MASVKLIKFLDKCIGSLICLVLTAFSIFKSEKKRLHNNILLIQLWGIGETILALPAIKALRKSDKKSTIDILVTGRVSDVFYKNGSIDKIKIVKLNPVSILVFILKNWRKYDLVIDMEEYLNISAIIAFFAGKDRIGYKHGLRANLYTKKIAYNDNQHVVQTFMDLLRPLEIDEKAGNLERLNYSDNDKNNVDKLLRVNNIKKNDFLVGLGFGAAESAKSRMWPIERFAKVADFLIEEYDAKVILVGNKNEKLQGDKILELAKNKEPCFNFAGKTSAREMFYFVSLCKLFIGNDSGPMHVAAAQGIKTIGLFGCNLPVRFRPFGKNGYYLYKKNNQDACINVHKGQVGECRFGIGNACVKKIHAEDAISLIKKIIK